MDIRYDRMYGEESPVLRELLAGLRKAERAFLDTAGKVTDGELARMLYQLASDYEQRRRELSGEELQRFDRTGASDRAAQIQTLCSGWRVPLEIGDNYSLLWEIERTLNALLGLHERFRNSPAGQVQEPLLERQHDAMQAGLVSLQRMRQRYDPYQPMISLDRNASPSRVAGQWRAVPERQ